MNIDILQGSLAMVENPGLDSTDPRLDEIATFSQAGKHLEAANLSEAILAEGIYDIRLICFFLYGYWLENGLTSLLPLMDCLNNVIQENWPAIGPVNNREKNLEKSLDWLFRQLLKKVQYEESKNSPLWQQWQTAADTVDLNRIQESGELLSAGLNLQLEDKAAALFDQWRKIEKWLLSFQQLASRTDGTEQSGEDDSEGYEDLEYDSEVTGLDNKQPAALTVFNAADLGIESSYHFELLMKKLAAFEQVIQENKFPQAALLADDINNTLANFDPKLYFPKLFENFVKQQVLNFEELIAYADHRDDPQWQAMQEWLKVDIDGFINN